MISLSYIIPYYNGSKYIRECLDSLYNQSVPETDFEVVIVDDKSYEDSLAVLYEYARIHSNIKILHNDYNLRVGASRNRGINAAVGKYIWFIDQDDKIESNCLQLLLNILDENKLDYISFDFADFSKNSVISHCLIRKNSEVMSGLDYAVNICNRQIWNNFWDTNVWHQIYNSDFLRKNNIIFSEISYFDDMIVALKSLFYAKRMQAISGVFYYYRYNKSSVLHSEVGVSGRTLYDSSINAGSILMNFSYEIRRIDIEFSKQFFEDAICRINSFTKQLLKISDKQKSVFYNMLGENVGIVRDCEPFLSNTNQFLLRNESIVRRVPLLLWLYLKLKELL